ncbi:MAG TPA: glycoside hydrolase family 3 N-terminal domain-containing protein [Puia sp.]|uniref:glycoside hydrolase family 3 N-terminal domain-containing protein n=1 Tax=Puia sp. TaxID=2045100 RepID=UPI002CBF5F5C|nr:glycoside hydrolase family 3 N-terminal domain-containing protein [Puia sp.]HVU96606.1 glycoside hydrolase family 3 N-terminal domain-containing protein [Puia sp.]
MPLFLLVLAAGAQTPADRQKVENLLRQMTIDEKIGQMTQVTLGVVSTPQDGVLDPAALAKAIGEYKVGSILNVTNHALTAEQWRTVQAQIQDEAKKTRLKIPVIYGLDGIHGQTYTLDATLFPQNIGMAAARDPELVAAAAKVTAKELRASGVRWNFAPVLDCGRQPLWSRFPETYGEDVYIGKTFGVTAIKAYEEDGLKNPTAVASCMKHYLAYSASRTGKDRTPIYLPEIEMREYYLPQFRAAVKAGASTLMVNSSEINGTPVHASKYLLTDVLRKQLGFQGVIVTDWEDIIRLHTRHNVAPTPRAAVVMAVNAGIDMSMVPTDFSFFILLKEAVQKGEVSLSRIDDAVRRILLLKAKVGLFDNPYPEPAAAANFALPEYQQLALRAAHEAMTLLKNEEDFLPLRAGMHLLVAGPAARSISALNGCWSYTWQGKEEQWYPAGSKTIYDALAEKFGADHVTTTAAAGFTSAANYDTTALKAAAAGSDAIVLCLGENAYAESPGTIGDLALPDDQKALARAAASTGKPVIFVLTEGRPRFITDIAPLAKGILLAYWSGRKAAEAISDVLAGDYNPDGRLPYSYPRSSGEMVLYDRKPTEDIREIFNSDMTMDGYKPMWPFGWGLTYTHFDYSDLRLSSAVLSGAGKLTVSVTVKNSGSRDGKHTVELYTRQHYASITPNMRRLRAFKKIFLKAGDSQTVSFTLDRDDLAFVNAAQKTVTEPGDFDVYIGNRKAGFSYKAQ